VKKLNFSRHPGENRVQEIGKPLKTLDSGFRRNDGEKTQIDFFTPSPCQEGKRIRCKKKIFSSILKTESALPSLLPKFLLGRCQSFLPQSPIRIIKYLFWIKARS
jgi:hypothetical protein